LEGDFKGLERRDYSKWLYSKFAFAWIMGVLLDISSKTVPYQDIGKTRYSCFFADCPLEIQMFENHLGLMGVPKR
jgi:hypothetical protein